ncbi:MAG: TonB-dependent receptor [Sphingobium sp.]
MSIMLRIMLASTSAMAMPMAAFAQDGAAAQPDQETATSGRSVGLEEIIVTATRRAESLQRVPLTVTAMTETGLRDAGIQNSRELQIATPGLTFNQAGGGFAQPYIHGIGTEITTPGGENSVPIFIDDVYVSQSLLGVQQLGGVERVEVLKGPQGTLYGRNASGGAINIQTKNPGNDPEGDLSASYGNYNAIKLQGYVSVPLSESLAANIAATFEDRDGFGKSLNTGQDINDLHYYSVRAKLRYHPTDNFEAILTGHYFDKDDKDHIGYTYTTAFGTSPVPVAVGANVTYNSQDLYTAYNNLGSRVQAGGANLRLKVELGDTTLTTVSSYAKMKNRIGVDYVSASLPVFNFQAITEARTFTQSIYVNGRIGDLTWTGGIQYLNDISSFGPNFAYVSGPAEPDTAAYASIKTESIAGYAEGTYAFNDIFKITGGVRLNRDRKTQRRLQIYGGPGLGNIDSPNEGAGTLLSSTPRNGRTFNSFTFKISPQAQITPDLLVYAKVETGFKSGTFNSLVAGDSVKPERITSYEAGFKSELFDDRVRVNLSAFLYNLKDLQIFYLNPQNGTTLIQSAPRSRIWGADLEVMAKLTEGLTLSAGATYLNAKYRDYVANSVYAPDPGGPGNQALFGVDVSGNRMQRAPEFTGNIRATYDFPLPDESGKLKANVQYYYSDSYYGDAIERFKIDSFDVVNAGLEYTLPGDRLSLEVWGRNLFNKFYFTYATVDPFGDRASPSDPRTYGATVRYKF